ncbi:hypothetical protein lpari_01073 [Legionella parisiensis]|uniref:Uncharacterized protein n=1 Tax=Legionella parisiensis TaxID=45071 RepID=A0A1E5JTR9_9GAMM|nr:hypothetical protein [Legionella parisiensis]OEH47885.1 hypothetical protein lpari_01073 [Legionella parisiensis]
MFSKDDLDATAGKVNISGQKKKADEYKKSMEDTFNVFISSTKQLPLEKQLKFIEEHLKENLPLDKKEHFLFFWLQLQLHVMQDYQILIRNKHLLINYWGI